jgi:hypothetical protein
MTIDAIKALGLENGASHTEIILDENGNCNIVEVAGRMGGDFIGSHMVQLSTGFDFLMATVDVALSQFDINKYKSVPKKPFSGVYYVVANPGKVDRVKNNSIVFPEIVFCEPLSKIGDIIDAWVDGSDKRSGIMVYSSYLANPISNPNEVLQIVSN